MTSDRLFDPEWRFRGFEAASFEVFAIHDREARRKAIIARFHPALEALASDVLERLPEAADRRLHPHLPRLDWPHGYQPFCTWLALSTLPHGYQAGPQLNLGVHRDHVAVRLAWDAAADLFGRFEFLARYGGLGRALADVAERAGLRFRVYASAPWPEGSRLVFESPEDWSGSFDETRRRGVWWELGARYDLPESLAVVASPAFGRDVLRVITDLLPIYDRIRR